MKTEKDLRDYLTDYPQQVAFGEEPSEVVLDRYHTASFVLTNDGQPLVRTAVREVRRVEGGAEPALVRGPHHRADTRLSAQGGKG